MHNPNRTLAVLLLLSIGGVSALGIMAYRYSRLLGEPAADDSIATIQRVDRFITVRRGMRREVDRHSAEGGQLSLTVTRDRALAFYGVEQSEYGDVRDAYRQWRSGDRPGDGGMSAALEHRRDELARLDLGDYESLDR